MKYFLDDEEMPLEVLLAEQEMWERNCGSYESVIILDSVENGNMYFCRKCYYED